MDCKNCDYCKSGTNTVMVGTVKRKMFFCRHPNQRAIVNFFMSHALKGQVGYVGRGNLYADKPEVDGAPKWCPINRRGGMNNE